MNNAKAAILLAGMLFGVSGAFLLWGSLDSPSGSSPDALRIGTANLNAQNRKPHRAASALAKAGADIVLLQEWTGQNANLSVLRESDLELVFSDPRPVTHGTAILAKPDLVEDAEMTPPPWNGPCAMPLVTGEMKTDGNRFGLLGVHAPPPTSSCRDSRVPYLEATAELLHDGRASRRVGAVSGGLPANLLGDLNAIDWEEPIRSISEKGLKDGSDADTWRPQFTWSPFQWLPPVLALDYVWIPEEWDVRAAHTVRIPGSDHRALFVDVVVP